MSTDAPKTLTLRGEKVTIPEFNSSRTIRAIRTLKLMAELDPTLFDAFENYGNHYKTTHQETYAKKVWDSFPEDKRAELSAGRRVYEVQVSPEQAEIAGDESVIVVEPTEVSQMSMVAELLPRVYDVIEGPLLDFVAFVMIPTKLVCDADQEGRLAELVRSERVKLEHGENDQGESATFSEIVELAIAVVQKAFITIRNDGGAAWESIRPLVERFQPPADGGDASNQ